MKPRTIARDASLEGAFWAAVKGCLTEFHAYSEDQADKAVAAYLKRLGKLSPGAQEIVYHNEPFYLACDLAGKQFEVDPEYRDAYSKILEKASY